MEPVIIGVVGAVVGLVLGALLFRRGAPDRSSESLPVSEAEAEDAIESSSAEEVDEERRALENELEESRELVARLEARVAELEGTVRARDEDAARSRRWLEARFRRMAQDFQTEWQEARLPNRVHDLRARTKAPAKSRVARMETLARQLIEWSDELELGSAEAAHQLGLWHVLEERTREAADAFQEAASRGMGIEAWLALGDCHWELDRQDKAADSYSHCLKNDAMPSHASWRYAEVVFAKGRIKEALAALEPSIDREDLPVDVRVLASRAAHGLGQVERAVEICERGLQVAPGDVDLLAEMIVPLDLCGRRKDAEKVAAEAAEAGPEAPGVPYALGRVHLAHDELDAAEKSFQKALQLDGRHPEALYSLGLVHNRRRRFKPALTAFRKAVDVRPDYAEAWYAMKDSYEGLKKFDEAIAALERATQLNPDLGLL